MSMLATKVRSAVSKVTKKAKELSPAKLVKALEKEQEVSQRLHAEVGATLKRMVEKDRGLAQQILKAYGFAVFPSVGRAGLVLGCSYGLGEVYKQGKLVGYGAAVQVTLGVQVGGQTYSELVLFQDDKALDLFKQGKVGFAANASAVIVKAEAASTNNYKHGMQIYVDSEGGLMLEADIGIQKLAFRGAGLTRGRKLEALEEGGWQSPQPEQEGGGAVASGGEGATEQGAEQTPPEAPRLFDGSEESSRQWKLVGSGDLQTGDGELRLAAGPELGLVYLTARRFDDVRLRLQYRPEAEDFDMALGVRFLDPEQPVPDRDEPDRSYPYDNQAFVAPHTGFEVLLGPSRPGAESGTFNGILIGDGPGVQARPERAEVKIGDWNDLELAIEADRFSVRLNGKETARLTNPDSYRGKPAGAGAHAGFIGVLMRKGRMAVRQVDEIGKEAPASAEAPSNPPEQPPAETAAKSADDHGAAETG